MNSVKSWSIVICAVSILCTVVEILAPNGKMKKMFKLILGSFLLISLLVPIKSMISCMRFDFLKSEKTMEKSNDIEKTVKNQTELKAKENLIKLVEKKLGLEGIKAEKINIIMDTKEDNCISIKKIIISLSGGDENKRENLKKELEKMLGQRVEIVVGSE